jgi:hypothetical protein
MSDPSPIYVGQFGPLKAADIVDRYLELTRGDTGNCDLVTGEAISSVAFTVTDAAGTTVPSVVGNHSESATRTDFRITVPAAGAYTLKVVFTIDDGQKITRTATLWSV